MGSVRFGEIENILTKGSNEGKPINRNGDNDVVMVSPRKKIALGAAIALLAILVVQLSTTGESGVARSVSTGTGSSSTVTTSTAIESSVVSSVTAQKYNVTFYDSGPCGSVYPPTSSGDEYYTEWGVQLGSWNMTEPSNMTLSQIAESQSTESSAAFNLTSIVFSVPPGVYSFALYPTILRVGSPDGIQTGGVDGLVNVVNSDVKVYTISTVQDCGGP
jgi:hypothetical protein